jgi:hypothetical protein
MKFYIGILLNKITKLSSNQSTIKLRSKRLIFKFEEANGLKKGLVIDGQPAMTQISEHIQPPVLGKSVKSKGKTLKDINSFESFQIRKLAHLKQSNEVSNYFLSNPHAQK